MPQDSLSVPAAQGRPADLASAGPGQPAATTVSGSAGHGPLPDPIIYTTDTLGNQYYTKDENGHEVYRDTDDSTKIFAVRDLKPYYAKKADQSEYYPIIDGVGILLTENGKQKYAKLSNGKEIYPTHADGTEFPMYEGGNPVYAKNELNQFYYPIKQNLLVETMDLASPGSGSVGSGSPLVSGLAGPGQPAATTVSGSAGPGQPAATAVSGSAGHGQPAATTVSGSAGSGQPAATTVSGSAGSGQPAAPTVSSTGQGSRSSGSMFGSYVTYIILGLMGLGGMIFLVWMWYRYQNHR